MTCPKITERPAGCERPLPKKCRRTVSYAIAADPVSGQPRLIKGLMSANAVTDRTPAPSPPYIHIREEMLGLMRALTEGMRIDSLMADQLSQISDRARLCGELEMADGLLDVTRQHRVAVLEGQGRLAALEARYAVLFPDES
ncbi:hypothetical protein MPPM_5297 [Methylorubrum populi]|uniref:Uncharacterized protein n=1 Tax=Methylorubrum populi TaxID=223967 RepID=A0A169RJ28_9HYPH|nr:hypothetical protein MPPM_5297 [Methylorubrum populi]